MVNLERISWETRVLLFFDPSKNFLRVGKEGLELGEYTWWSRIIKKFWKPHNERIDMIANLLFKEKINEIKTSISAINSDNSRRHMWIKLTRLAFSADRRLNDQSILVNVLAAQVECALSSNQNQLLLMTLLRENSP